MKRMWMAQEVIRLLSLPSRSRRGLLPSHRQVIQLSDDIGAWLFSPASDLRFDQQTNGTCERFRKTVLNEFYRIAFRKKVYRSIDELQVDLDLWTQEYNRNPSTKSKEREDDHMAYPESRWRGKITEWTSDDEMRHPVFLGLRIDKRRWISSANKHEIFR